MIPAPAREIRLTNIMMRYPIRGGSKLVLDNVSIGIRKGERLGILGRNGSGKSTLIRIIGGATAPTSGRVFRGMSVSWPLAFGGAFQGSLTGIDNLRFVCRVYGVDFKPALRFIEEFAELGVYLREPVKTYSAGMRARLNFALSFAVRFECLLIDEIVAVGDRRFHERCRYELIERNPQQSLILVSHDEHYVRDMCTRVGVLVDGRYREFADLDEGFEFYRASLALSA